MAIEELPLGPYMEVPTAKLEIGEEHSLRVGSSVGGVLRCEGKLLKRGARRCGNEQSLGGRRRRQGVSLGSHVLDASGTELLSRRVENDEAEIARLIDEALSRWLKGLSGQ
jgi:hypothetical protein